MFDRLTYWLLARLPRWSVVGLYTGVFIALGAIGLVVLVGGGLLLLVWLTQNGDAAIRFLIGCIVGYTIYKITQAIDRTLPSRKHKNDETSAAYAQFCREINAGEKPLVPLKWHIHSASTNQHQGFLVSGYVPHSKGNISQTNPDYIVTWDEDSFRMERKNDEQDTPRQ